MCVLARIVVGVRTWTPLIARPSFLALRPPLDLSPPVAKRTRRDVVAAFDDSQGSIEMEPVNNIDSDEEL